MNYSWGVVMYIFCFLAFFKSYLTKNDLPLNKLNNNFVILNPTQPGLDADIKALSIGSTPYWTPTEKDIQKLENVLMDFLKQNPARNGKIVDLNNYGRQYIGCTRKNRKVIYLNAFCHPEREKERWKNQLIIVQDGGACYFQVYFIPETSQFVDLNYNGEA
jgi:hypothetical protein